MSIQTKQGTVGRSSVKENEVVAYLKQHPDFFENNTALLAELNIPHISGNAVSLVERQVAVLRKKNADLQGQLDDFLQIASDNEKLNQQIYRLTLAIIQTQSLSELLDLLHKSMRQDFLADDVAIKLLAGDESALSGRPERVVDEFNFRTLFEDILGDGHPMVGKFNARQRDYLFNESTEDIGSMAILPFPGKKPLGLLAIGSYDESRFHAGMGTVYLNQMGSLIGKTISRFIDS